MDESSEANNPMLTPIPNLDDLDPWLEKNITHPLTGFEDKTDPKTHRKITPEQATEESREQLRNIAKGRKELLDYKNQRRISQGLLPMTEEEHDRSIIENFIAIAKEQTA